MGWLEQATRGHLGEALDIVRNRTIAGAYWAYMGLEARHHLADCCTSSSSLFGPLSAGGFGPSVMLADHSLRFCESCSRDEIQRSGVGRWDIAKQLPGAWVCTHHRRPLHVVRSKAIAWHLPELAASVQIEVIGGEALDALYRLACIVAAARELDRVHVAGLAAACLARLMERGVIFGRSRGRESGLQRWFGSTPIGLWLERTSDVSALPSGRWVNALLTNRRASHPLRWALLWTALTQGESGPSCAQAFVDAADDNDAVELHLQLPLWPVLRVPAPEGGGDSAIRAALERCTSLSDAATLVGMSIHALTQWMTHDASLLRRWRANASRRRTRAALETAHSFFAKQPTAGWPEFIATFPSHVFWLRARAPELFQRLLAARGLLASPQLSIFDNCDSTTGKEAATAASSIEREAARDS